MKMYLFHVFNSPLKNSLESRKGQGGGWGKKVGARGVGGDGLGETALLLLPPD